MDGEDLGMVVVLKVCKAYVKHEGLVILLIKRYLCIAAGLVGRCS